VDQPLHDGVRLSLGLAPDRRQLESALRRINQLLTDTAPARLQG
jgi:hypothetical protein